MDIPATITQLAERIDADPPASAKKVTKLAEQLGVTFEQLRNFANEILSWTDEAHGALDALVDADREDRPDAHTALIGALVELRDTLIVPQTGDDPSGEYRPVSR